MLEWALIGLGAAVAGGAGWAWRRSRGRAEVRRWAPVVEAVARRFDGYASAEADHPSLRCTVDGLTVTLTLLDADRGPARARAEADVALPDTNNIVRLYVGWDTVAPPAGLDHVPEVDVATTGLDGHVVVRADDAAAARALLAATALDLVDVRREALAEAVEVTVRGGYLQLAVHGTQAHEATLERTLLVASHLARTVDAVSARDSAGAPGAAPERGAGLNLER